VRYSDGNGLFITRGATGCHEKTQKTQTKKVDEVSDGAAWQFFGGRTAALIHGNGIICSFMNNAQSRSAIQAGQPTPPRGSGTSDQLGYDGAGRLIAKRYLLPHGGPGSPAPSTLVVGFTTATARRLFSTSTGAA
jgi:hypothetical protein